MTNGVGLFDKDVRLVVVNPTDSLTWIVDPCRSSKVTLGPLAASVTDDLLTKLVRLDGQPSLDIPAVSSFSQIDIVPNFSLEWNLNHLLKIHQVTNYFFPTAYLKHCLGK